MACPGDHTERTRSNDSALRDDACASAALQRTAVIHVWGLAWELSAAEVAVALEPLLPPSCAMVEPPVLPLDKRSRSTGRALLRLRLADSGAAAAAVAALQRQRIGSRWLEVRESGEPELAAARASQARLVRAPQTFCQPTTEHSFVMPDGTLHACCICVTRVSGECRVYVARLLRACVACVLHVRDFRCCCACATCTVYMLRARCRSWPHRRLRESIMLGVYNSLWHRPHASHLFG